jgi:protein-tyrosine-phosphatase
MAIKSKVLFLCSENSCRTQMAEALLRDVAGDRFEIVSAGNKPAKLIQKRSRRCANSGSTSPTTRRKR